MTSRGAGGNADTGSGDSAHNSGQWRLIIEAIAFVTHAVIDVWTGVKHGGPEPTGLYTLLSGCDPASTLTIEAAS